ncbi:hypothetical protein WBO78_23505 [Bosea sp. CCNWLW174]
MADMTDEQSVQQVAGVIAAGPPVSLVIVASAILHGSGVTP